jgi:hypothetical protein
VENHLAALLLVGLHLGVFLSTHPQAFVDVQLFLRFVESIALLSLHKVKMAIWLLTKVSPR